MAARRRLVVVGGDAAGMSAATQARRRRSEDELDIVCFERGQYTSYAACGIPFFVGDLVPDASDLVARSPEEHRRRGLDVRVGHDVVAIDTAHATVRVRDLAKESETDEPFDQLVVATGATPVRPPIPGIDARGIFGVQSLADGIAVRAAVTRATPAARSLSAAGTSGSSWPRRWCSGVSTWRSWRAPRSR